MKKQQQGFERREKKRENEREIDNKRHQDQIKELMEMSNYEHLQILTHLNNSLFNDCENRFECLFSETKSAIG